MIGGDGTRREFFHVTVGRLAAEVARRTERRVSRQPLFRPPGAIDEVAFLAACTRCSECVNVCPAHAIVPAAPHTGLAAGTPRLEPTLQACTVCDEIPCAAACPTGALIPPERGWEGYAIGRLELVPETCIAFTDETCDACVRICPVGARAIVSDEAGRPVIRAEGCVGCGVCLRACPTSPRSLILHRLESR